MAMPDTERIFFYALKNHLELHHQQLRCTAPSSGVYISKGRTAPSPDVIVENPLTGAALAIELKSGPHVTSLPFATVPQMKAMKTAFDSIGTWFILLTIGDAPQEILSRLLKEEIPVTQASTVQDALTKIDPKLKALEESEG